MLSETLELVVLQHFEDLSTPFSLMCAILWRHGEKGALVRLECRPEDYDTSEKYFRSVAALALVKKLKGLFDNDDVRQSAAVKKWFEGEVDCYRSNQRLYSYLPGTSLERNDAINRHFAGIRRVVLELIGPAPPDLLQGRFGPGATFANRGSLTTVPHKMHTNPTLTSDCIWFLPQFLGTAWGQFVAAERELSFVRGNRFQTVPKTAVIDRSIAVEPSINVFYQLAIGRALRRRLQASHGWDLDNAQAVHRKVAETASVSREFATLDLSNASDTVSYNLVKLLIPPKWFSVMDSLRSPFTSHPSHTPQKGLSWVKLEKFSSMGNGYTFELETVLFAAMAIYVTREVQGFGGILGQDVFVFGDDIIVRDELVRSLTALLNFTGFTLNSTKSFSGWSPFRESCGADYYVGDDVRPSYIKEDPRDVQGSFGVANRLWANIEKAFLLGRPIDDRSWYLAYRAVPSHYRVCRGPRDLGDAVMWGNESTWRVRWKHSIRYVCGLKPGDQAIVPFDRFDPRIVLACATYGTGNVGTPERGRVPDVEGVRPRDAIRSHVRGWLPFS